MLSCNFLYQRNQFCLDAQLDCKSLVTGILGESGAGKSTFLKIIAGLLQPQKGYVHFDSQVMFDSQTKKSLACYQRHIGLVFQDGQLFPHLNVKQNLLYGYKQLKPAQRRFSLAQVVSLLEIESLIERKINQLSGGEKQRVALGRAILYSPQLLLLDEPLSALDQRLKAQILPFFARIRDETRIPMIYVTHQPSELEFLQADIRHMHQGRILLASPSH